MSDSPFGKPAHPQSKGSISQALDAVDKSQARSRLFIGFVVVGVLATAIWFDFAIRNSVASTTEIIVRAVGVVAAMLALITVSLRNAMNKNTQTILRAIAETDSKLKRLS
jgi:hypothetical protein